MDNNLDMMPKRTGMLRATNQRLADLEHEARQPRLATEADVEPDTETRKRMEDAAADRAKHGDKSSSTRVDHNPIRLISFGDDTTEPPVPERSIRDALVDEGAEAPKPCLGQEHEARQPCLATETGVKPDAKTRKHTDDAAADRAKYGDKSSSARVDHDLMRRTSVGDDSTEPPAP